MDSFWLLGCGNMAGAMLKRWLDCGLNPDIVTVVRPSGRPVAPGVRVLPSLPVGEAPPSALIIGVKPAMLGSVAPDIAAVTGADTVLISILAGVTCATLRERLGPKGRIVRTMPNTPVAIGRGVIALHAADIDTEVRTFADKLMTPLGLAEWIADEDAFDLVTALSGSGPAFLFRFIDAMARAAADLGLPADQAERFALATIEGAGRLAALSGESPALLAERVASPGGSTRKGLDVLDDQDALIDLLRATLAAATRRNAEMAAEARR